MSYLQDIYCTNINVVYNTGGYFSLPSGGSWAYKKHRFEQCKFYFILDGACTVEVDGTPYNLTAGDWLLIPPNVEHAYQNDKSVPFRKFWAHFDVYSCAEFFSALNLPFTVKVSTKGNVFSLFKKMTKLAESNSLTDKLLVKGCLINLLAEFINLAKPDGVSVVNTSDERLDGILRFINENLSENLSNELLAEKYFTHPNHFIRAFRDKTGVTPAKYVKQKRMEAAKRLLESTDLTTAEISERVGISDVAHFSRAFKERYNTPPSKHKKYFKEN